MRDKPVGEMTRREVMSEIKHTWWRLSREEQTQVLQELDVIAVEMRLPRSRLPGRAALSLIRSVRERQQRPAVLQSSLP